MMNNMTSDMYACIVSYNLTIIYFSLQGYTYFLMFCHVGMVEKNCT